MYKSNRNSNKKYGNDKYNSNKTKTGSSNEQKYKKSNNILYCNMSGQNIHISSKNPYKM